MTEEVNMAKTAASKVAEGAAAAGRNAIKMTDWVSKQAQIKFHRIRLNSFVSSENIEAAAKAFKEAAEFVEKKEFGVPTKEAANYAWEALKLKYALECAEDYARRSGNDVSSMTGIGHPAKEVPKKTEVEMFEEFIKTDISKAAQFMENCATDNEVECNSFGATHFEALYKKSQDKAYIVAIKCLDSHTQQCKNIGFKSFALIIQDNFYQAYGMVQSCLRHDTSQCVEIARNSIGMFNADMTQALKNNCAGLNTLPCLAIKNL